MVVSISNFKKVELDLSSGVSEKYSITNNVSAVNNCYLYFFLTTSVSGQNVTIVVEQYTNGVVIKSDTYILNSVTNTITRFIDLVSPSTLISIDCSGFSGYL